jgi:hypothetical protein
LVRIDLRTGATSVVPLGEAPGPLAAAGNNIWVVADPDWYDLEDEGDSHSADHVRTRQIVFATGFQAGPRAAEDFDDYSFHMPPRPVWRVEGDVVTNVAFSGEVFQLVPVEGDEFLVVLRRPDDPVVVTPDEWGGGSFAYPGVIARCAPPDFAPIVLVELPETSGSLIADGTRYWLSGFGFEAHVPAPTPRGLFGADPNPLQQLDVETGNLVMHEVTIEPDAIVDNFAVVISREHASPFGGRTVRSFADCHDLSRTSDPLRVELPQVVETYGDIVVSDGVVWFAAEDAAAVVWVHPRTGTAGQIVIEADLGPETPAPEKPTNVDLEQFEQSQLTSLRDSLLGGWTDESGNTDPFIGGVEFQSIELVGRFPHSHIVARFRAADRSGILFGRRWDLYDELGNPQDLEYADMHLMEDIEAAGWGLPPVEECRPDNDGLVWF